MKVGILGLGLIGGSLARAYAIAGHDGNCDRNQMRHNRRLLQSVRKCFKTKPPSLL